MNEFMSTRKLKTANWKDQPIDFRNKHVMEGTPTELHLKENGAVNEDGIDQPSFAILIKAPHQDAYMLGQMSLATITDCFSQLGYELRKVEHGTFRTDHTVAEG